MLCQPSVGGVTVESTSIKSLLLQLSMGKSGLTTLLAHPFWQSYNDLFVHSDIFISMTHICDHGP